MVSTSPIRGCVRAAAWLVSGTWSALKFTANWITSPTKLVGTGVGVVLVKNSYDESRLFLGSKTTAKTDALKDAFVHNDPFNPFISPACPDVNGLFGALGNCPLPFKAGSSECYGRGWETSFIGQSSVGQSAQQAAKPIRFAANAAYCFATEKGTLNSMGCAVGFDQTARKQIEEKISLAGIFALLALVWYLPRPREDDENKKRV